MRIRELVAALETWAPLSLAEAWDAPGLQVGDTGRECTGILCCLDVTPEVLQEAIRLQVNLILSHHPLLFGPLKSVDLRTPLGKLVEACLVNGLTVYSLHTNMDRAVGGLNDYAAELMGLQNVTVLPSGTPVGGSRQIFKLVTFVPRTSRESLLQALFRAGGGKVGTYGECSFTCPGTGTFLPGEGTAPTVGTKGVRNEVPEDRIEVLFDSETLSAGVRALRFSHPYEVPAFDIIPLYVPDADVGYVRVGSLTPALPWETFLERVRTVFTLRGFRIVGERILTVSRVALCTGSGASFIPEAAQTAEVYITGDLKYHEAQEAISLGLTVIDAGHFSMERIFIDLMGSWLNTNGFQREIDVFKSQVEHDPFTFFYVGGNH